MPTMGVCVGKTKLISVDIMVLVRSNCWRREALLLYRCGVSLDIGSVTSSVDGDVINLY